MQNTESSVKVHRCRFLDWKPSAIHVLATNNTKGLCAVGRENGDIELWSKLSLTTDHGPDRAWQVTSVIRGSTDIPLTALCWSNDDSRLFASSRNGTIFEVDLESLSFKSACDSFGGAIWCMVSHPTLPQVLIGCEDGKIRVYDIENNSSNISYSRRFMSNGTRVVSLAFHPSGNTLFSGHVDGVVAKWDVQTGRSSSRITFPNYANEKTIIWSLAVLVADDQKSSTLVTGDSMGNVSFYDSETCTLRQTFSQLTADVLAIATNASHTSVFASGIDSQVIMLKKVSQKWVYTYSHRSHSHDVRALATLKGEKEEVLVSGGVDTQLAWYPTESFSRERPNKLSPFPQTPIVTCAPAGRLLLLSQEARLDIWKVPNSSSLNDEVKALVCQLNIAGGFNISATAVSRDGSYVAVSTQASLKVFKLDKTSFQPSKVLESPEPATAMHFTNDQQRRRLIVAGSSSIRVIDLERNNESTVLKGNTTTSSIAKTLAISPLEKWLVVGEESNVLRVYNFETKEFHGVLARPDKTHLALSFGINESTLFVSGVCGRLWEYDVESLSLLKSSFRMNSTVKKFLHGHRVVGIRRNPLCHNHVLMQSQNAFLSMQVHACDSLRPLKKLKTDEEGSLTPASRIQCKTVDEYRPMLHLDFLGKDEIVVVEMPWLKILQTLPDVLYRHQYGK